MTYVVVMGNITVPNLTEISVRNNLFQFTPRSLLNPHLNGYNREPAIATVRTRTNVEDFYRFNAPLLIFKKIKGVDEKKQALLTLDYMRNTIYNDIVYPSMLTIINLGYLPVFLGVCQSYTSAMGNSAESVGYEHLISASDLSTFFNFPFRNLTDKNGKVLDFQNFKENITKSTSTNINKYFGNIPNPIGGGEEVLGRAPFICEMLNTIIENLPAYKEYKRTVQYPILSDIKQAIAQLGNDVLVGGIAGSDDFTALIAAKIVATIKIPRGKYESDQTAEAIKSNTLESNLTTLANAVGENLNFREVLQAMTPHIFYETGFREDTGEFFFRRSGACGAKQSFQNPKIPAAIIPTGSILEYQKIWGGKLGESIASQVHGQTQLYVKNFAPYVELGEKNQNKFGSSQFRQDTFGQLQTFFYTIKSNGILQSTEEFCGNKNHYQIKPKDNLVTNFSFNSLLNIKKQEALGNIKNMANYTSKYNHSFPYLIWIGCSTYFMAPLGASVQPIVFPHTASALGVTSGRLAITTDPFTSIESLNSYRIAGKALEVNFRSDGAYDERYHLALTHAGVGFSQSV